MIKAEQAQDGTTTITADARTAEMIWALADGAAQDPDSSERTREIAEAIARALTGIDGTRGG